MVRFWNTAENLLFWLLIALCLAPLWWFEYFPSQDGPSHVYNALVLRDLLRGDGGGFQNFFHINPFPIPNLLGHWLMAGMMMLVSPWTAQKLLLSAYVVLLPMSVRYAVGKIRPGATAYSFLCFPLIYSLLLHKGLYNFCLSLPFFFFFVGYWIGRDGRFDARAACVVLGLSLLMYFAHVVAVLEAYATVGLWSGARLVAAMAARRRATSGAESRPQIFLQRILMPGMAVAPSLILMRNFFQTQDSQTLGDSFSALLAALAHLNCLISYRLSEAYLSIPVLCLFAALTVAGLGRVVVGRKWVMHDALLAGVLAAGVLYFITPNNAAGGGLISPRLMLFIFLILILWLACTPLPRWASLAVPILSGILCAAMLTTYAARYREFNNGLRDYVSCAKEIPPGSTFLPLCVTDGTAQNFNHGIRVFLHAGAYLAVDRRLIDLANYEAAQNYFPILYVPQASPERVIKEDGSGLLNYRVRTSGRRIDYVLVWDVLSGPAATAPATTREDLHQEYKQVYLSPRGFLKLYQCNELR